MFINNAKKSKYDCITSDVMMPNMDGFTMRSHVNEHQEWRQIPFLLLTARYMEEDKIKGFQLGIDDYITKPFSTRELQARIHNLISSKLERDAFIKNETTSDQEDTRLTADQKLLKQVEQAVLGNLDNYDFTVDDLSKEIGYSSPHLRRLIKKLTGFTMVAFILEIRLQKARTLLEKGLCATVTEVQLEVGISSLPYFTRKFTQWFGVNPNKIRKMNE